MDGNRMAVAVLGPGGVGGLLAGALARAGARVVVVGREQTAARIRAGGLRVRSRALGDFAVRPEAVARLERPVDALLVATKADGLEAGLTRVATGPPLVVPLLNGLDHMGVLRARFGGAVRAGAITVVSDRPRPGEIVQTSPAIQVALARDGEGGAASVERLAAALEAAGVEVTLRDGEADVLWTKLVRLAALTTTLGAAGRTWGEVWEDPRWRRRLEAAVHEVAAVAAADGAAVDPAATLAGMRSLPATATTSLQRDLAAGRPTELDAIAGSVLRAARRHGIACPTLAELTDEIAERESVSPGGHPATPR